jgi:uncharacterized low-complexity protein
MSRIAMLIIFALAFSTVAITFQAQGQDQDAREAAQKAVQESMARAQAEKARNDRVVEQQRASERAAKASPSPREGKSTPDKVKPERAKPEKATPDKSKPDKK